MDRELDEADLEEAAELEATRAGYRDDCRQALEFTIGDKGIVCPSCQGDVLLAVEAGEGGMTGSVVCHDCGTRFYWDGAALIPQEES